ncbi:MAG TPA: 23S rRNA (guanosine(2251)-2'-O)-methyltransferase RlmB [Candidatus Eisenbacteria bacterium]|nr:23S rRNA (guanosine(2251)-2'-O)-methyltransferase RlmB [Candidatus Eisenbacteria bacterium]
MAPRPVRRPVPRTPGPAPNRAPSRIPAAGLIHGRNAVLEAARAGRVVKVYQASGLGHDPRLDELASLTRIEVVPAERLDVIAPGVHQGVAAELQPRREWPLKELLATNPTLLVALDSIMDPMNLGAILRSAEVAGAEGAIIPEHRSAPLSPAAVKASSGASELLRISQVSGLPSAITEVKRSGIWCVALDPRGEMPAWDFDFTQRVCVVIGSEGEGVHRLVRERCDARVRLPVKGHIASLNASAAASALLYEISRQRAGRAQGTDSNKTAS